MMSRDEYFTKARELMNHTLDDIVPTTDGKITAEEKARRISKWNSQTAAYLYMMVGPEKALQLLSVQVCV